MKLAFVSSLAFACALSLFPAAALAGQPPTRAMTLLVGSHDRERLRSELARYADSTRAHDPTGAGEARYDRGWTFVHDASPDSAIADLLLAAQLRGAIDDHLALADAWIARRRPADLDSTVAWTERLAPAALGRRDQLPYRVRLAWALQLSGRSDSARRVMKPLWPAIESDPDPVWRERLGRVASDAHDDARAVRWLLPVVISSRGLAADARAALQASFERVPDPRRAPLDVIVTTVVAQRNARDRMWTEKLGGRRVQLRTEEGFPLAACAFARAGSRGTAVVLMASGDSLSGCDSLIGMLRAARLGVVLVERRGTGGAVGLGLAIPSDAYGRDNEIDRSVARDAFAALRAAAGQVELDTTHVLLVGLGDALGAAVHAATLEPRPGAMLLVSPQAHPVELGVLCGQLGSARLPLFIQTSAEDLDLYVTTDALYESSDRAHSRLVEAHVAGHGAELFRQGGALGDRFSRWLDDAFHPTTSRAGPNSKAGANSKVKPRTTALPARKH